MSNQLDRYNPTALEHQADLGVCQHFSEDLKQLPVTRDAVERLGQNLDGLLCLFAED